MTLENKISKLEQNISLLNDIGEVISSSDDINRSFKSLLQIVFSAVNSSAVSLLLFDPQKRELKTAAAIGIKEKKISIPISKELESKLLNKAPMPALKAKIWMPLSFKEELLGVISLSDYNDYNEQDFHFLSLFSQYISIALYNFKLQRTLKQVELHLNLKSLELETMVDISREVNSVADGVIGLSSGEISKLMDEITSRTLALLDASGCCLMLINDKSDHFQISSSFPDLDLVGQNIPVENGVLWEIFSKGEPKTVNRCSKKSSSLPMPIKCQKFLGVPISSQEGVLGILCAFDKVNRDGSMIDFSESDQSLIYGFANQAGIALENAKLYKEAIEKRVIQAEIKAAADIQNSLFPKVIPQIQGFDIVAMNQQRGNNVGGDYYDFLDEDEGQRGLLIADVSGKGLQAALSMARLCAGVHSEVEHRMSLTEMVYRLNNLLRKKMPFGKYITFFYASLDPKTKSVNYVNAGHEFPMLLRSDGSRKDLDVGGFFLGMFEPEMVSYESEEIKLYPGDILLLYTDGVTDATNRYEETFGKDRLESVIKTHAHLSAEEIKEEVYNAVIDFEGSAPRFDDLTFVVIKVR